MGNIQNLIGQRFGKLVVEQDIGRYSTNEIKWLCKCDCGNTRITKTYFLKRGINSCVKCNYEDLTNQKFGKLLVIKRIEDKINSVGGKVIQWLCKCECDNETTRTSYELKRGKCCCKECKAELDRKNNGTGYKDISGIYWSSIKGQAIKRDVEFSIDIEYAYSLFELQNGKCKLSGMEIQFAKNKVDYLNGGTTASLDRIDSDLGYIKGNVQWVHKWINRMKSNHSQNVFIDLCKKVSLWQSCVHPSKLMEASSI